MAIAHDAFATRLKAAHTALFDLIKRYSGDLTHTTYAEAGISLQIVPGVAARATAKLFCGTNGQFVPVLELAVPDVRTASYLLLDTINAVQSGRLDQVINNSNSMCAHIDEMDGYPTIFEWFHK